MSTPHPPMSPEDPIEARLREAIAHPRNMGEMADADAVGTVGSPDCGDMLRMWLKFSEKDGRKVIDRASFQSFGCQTAIAVASVATELLAGKTVEEAMNLDAADLSRPLGPLPPMKIHCGQMVEGALRRALEEEGASRPATGGGPADPPPAEGQTLLGRLAPSSGGRLRIVTLEGSDA